VLALRETAHDRLRVTLHEPIVISLRLASTSLGSEQSESWSHVDEPSGVARSMPRILTRKIFQMSLPAPLGLVG